MKLNFFWREISREVSFSYFAEWFMEDWGELLILVRSNVSSESLGG
jgi:hypothetical protein